jgi:hypothetical protein
MQGENMQPLVEAACNVITSRKKLAQAETALFHDHKVELCRRLREIASILTRGIQEPITSERPESILFSIKDFTDEDFEKRKYPASSINWDTYYLDNTLQIKVEIEAIFRGECDAYFTLLFPVKQDDYIAFIKELNKKAKGREDALKAKEAKEQALAEEAEKKTLAALLQKYGS